MEAVLRTAITDHPHPLIFATISGAHLYGFPSADSDYDLRGAHVLPLRGVVGLDPPPETVEIHRTQAVPQIDLVTHDVAKFIRLMLRKNGYVLEQLLSPLVVHTTREHEELKALAPQCITRYHAHHYVGFARTQWELFRKEDPPRVKPLLYVYRVLLTGIHLMRTGEVEANLVRLNEEFRLPYIPDLIAAKMGGGEGSQLRESDLELHEAEYERLRAELETAYGLSSLPAQSSARDALNDVLIRIRLEAGTGRCASSGDP
ncbi:MAG: nucleotidyltransferase [Armatimonadetes bacterium]|nr:nucleotidyltransferase [Armatimonadota bacterium]